MQVGHSVQPTVNWYSVHMLIILLVESGILLKVEFISQSMRISRRACHYARDWPSAWLSCSAWMKWNCVLAINPADAFRHVTCVVALSTKYDIQSIRGSDYDSKNGSKNAIFTYNIADCTICLFFRVCWYSVHILWTKMNWFTALHFHSEWKKGKTNQYPNPLVLESERIAVTFWAS